MDDPETLWSIYGLEVSEIQITRAGGFTLPLLLYNEERK